MSTIHFIGGEKGGVGKSVVARLLAQYCIDQKLPFVALDADGSHGSLLRYYRDYARAIDLASAASVDQIFELATEEDRRVIVDLPAQSDRLVVAWLAEAGVFEVARECEVNLVFWHVLDGGKDSTTALERTLARHTAGARYCIVRNFGRGKDFSSFDHSKVKERAEALGALIIDLPELSPQVMQKVDEIDASFWAAAHNPNFAEGKVSRLDRMRLKVWLLAGFHQLARLGPLL
jgi:hypothetical protein